MQDKDSLDDLFAEARKDTPAPGDDLVARVLADARAVQDQNVGAVAGAGRINPPGRLRAISDMIGGWPALTGMAAAGIAGLWIGVAPTAAIDDLRAQWLGQTSTVSFLGEIDLIDGWEAIDG